MKRRTRAAPPRSADQHAAASISSLISPGRVGSGAAILLTLAVGMTYRGVLSAPFIFDDTLTIVGNASLRSLWPLLNFSGGYSPLQAPAETTVFGRPVVNLSLALNYHFSQLDPRGYRLTNVALHVLVALVLAAIVRRTLRLDFFQRRFTSAADPLALAAALLWALHPLNTECVAYITQRSEVIMGLAYLLTLYMSQLYWSTQNRLARAMWLILAVVVCQLGMFSKESMASVPAIVLLYERTFVAGSFRRAIGASWPLYVALALTWLPLAAFNLHGPRTPIVGFGLGVSGFEWWCTQCKVLFLYLKLSVWPWPLVIHYDMPYLDSIAAAWPWVALTSLLIAAIVFGVLRGSAWGFVGTWFFAVLSPTLLIPLTAEIAAERRMYVVLTALIPAAVAGCYALLRRAAASRSARTVAAEPKLPLVLTLAAAAVLAGAYSLIDLRRLAVYTDKLTLWSDTAENQPNNHIVQLNLATALDAAGRRDEAIEHYFARSSCNRICSRTTSSSPSRCTPPVGCRSRNSTTRKRSACARRRGPALRTRAPVATRRRVAAHKEEYELALRLFPDFPRAHYGLGTLLEAAGNNEEARQHYEAALRPEWPTTRRPTTAWPCCYCDRARWTPRSSISSSSAAWPPRSTRTPTWRALCPRQSAGRGARHGEGGC